MIVILLFLYGIDRSYIGKTFKAIAQDDSLAASAGMILAAAALVSASVFSSIRDSMPITWV